MNSFPLLTNLKSCVLIWKSGQTLDSFNKEEIYKYFSVYPEARHGHVWYDTVESKLFSHAHFRNGPAGKDHSYCCSSEAFLSSRWGNSYIQSHLNSVFAKQEIIATPEIIFSRPDVMKKFVGSSVMLVGGGPSAGTVEWTKKKYDHIWTMNKFYEPDVFWDNHPSLVTLATNVDLSEKNEQLHSFMKWSPETFVSFEIERGSIENDWKLMDDFCAMYPERVGFYHTRYRSQPGVALRLLVFAALVGAKTIDYVGIDGFQKVANTHFFEGVKDLPNWFVKFGPRFEDRQRVLWLDYLRDIQEEKNIQIYNLAENK